MKKDVIIDKGRNASQLLILLFGPLLIPNKYDHDHFSGLLLLYRVQSDEGPTSVQKPRHLTKVEKLLYIQLTNVFFPFHTDLKI